MTGMAPVWGEFLVLALATAALWALWPRHGPLGEMYPAARWWLWAYLATMVGLSLASW
jgi:hypothetical protein